MIEFNVRFLVYNQYEGKSDFKNIILVDISQNQSHWYGGYAWKVMKKRKIGLSILRQSEVSVVAVVVTLCSTCIVSLHQSPP